jgi:hypothetical protein
MNRIHLGALVGMAAVATGVTLLAAPAAQAGTDLGADGHVCDALHGKFTTEIMGGQSRSTCTFTVVGYTHDFYYSDGQLTSWD